MKTANEHMQSDQHYAGQIQWCFPQLIGGVVLAADVCFMLR
jgi:hypothetical protein